MYQTLYYRMFNAATDALTAMEAQNYGQAAEILRQAQKRAEEIYLQSGDEKEALCEGPGSKEAHRG